MGKKYNGYIAYNESTKTKCIYVGKHPLEKGKNIWLVAFENYMYDKTNAGAYKTKEVSTCRIFKDKELLFDEEAIISIKNRISQLESEITNLKTKISTNDNTNQYVENFKIGIERCYNIIQELDKLTFDTNNKSLQGFQLSFKTGDYEKSYVLSYGEDKSFVESERTRLLKEIHSMEKGIRTILKRQKRQTSNKNMYECDIKEKERLILYNTLLIEEILKQKE